MATRIIMPKQGLQMTEGTITKWLYSEGDAVEENKPLFEMETDKLNIDIDSPVSGTLLKIVREAGETVPITELIAVIGGPGEDISAIVAGDSKIQQNKSGSDTSNDGHTAVCKAEIVQNPGDTEGSSERIFITPRAKMVASEKNLDYSSINGTGPDGLIIEKDVLDYAASWQETKAQPKATPLAARLASIKDVSLNEIEGTGPKGKITKSDVLAVTTKVTKSSASIANNEKIIPFTGMRKVISDRMMQSLHNTAQANHRMKVDMSEVVRFREKLKADDIKVSFTDIFVKTVSKALLEFPILNSSLTDKGILLKEYVNIGLAVAVENGLIVPVIKNADTMSLKEISEVSVDLIAKAQNGRLTAEDYTGGTFTITNLGMFDIDEFTAILNPPESGILAIGKIDRIPIVEGDNIVIRPVMVMSLTYDHRIIDGAPAAKFLQRVKQLLQDPYLLI
jgi:Pyruvate/2-oxoglutarate dehydrogenase complex, dihydrolipoamide acyltransferase (E2) component, and related enzymes